jgi:hypothetical protein
LNQNTFGFHHICNNMHSPRRDLRAYGAASKTKETTVGAWDAFSMLPPIPRTLHLAIKSTNRLNEVFFIAQERPIILSQRTLAARLFQVLSTKPKLRWKNS